MSKLICTKITSIPTTHAWSQIYNAGNLVSLIALSHELEDEGVPKAYESLATIGKELLNILESEYFTLEEKTLESIKKAVSMMTSKIPAYTKATIIVGTAIDNVFYLYLYGRGKVLIKRGHKTGVLLEPQELAIDSEYKTIETASGKLEPNDTIIFATHAFLEIVHQKDLLGKIMQQTPYDLAEELEPQMHAKRDGSASAVIIEYQTEQKSVLMVEEEITTTVITEDTSPMLPELTHEPTTRPTNNTDHDSAKPKLFGMNENREDNMPQTHQKKILPRLSKRRTISLAIACIIALIFIGVIIFSAKKHKTIQVSQFPAIYNQAQAKYKEGMNLKSLNPKDAQDDFTAAQQLLSTNQNIYPPSTPDGKKLQELLTKVNEELQTTKVVENGVATKELDSKDISYLEAQIKNPHATYFYETTDTILALDTNQVSNINPSTFTSKQLIKNDNIWADPGGLAAYQGNIYILDRKASQIFKFIPSSGSEYGKNMYFTSEKPDLTKANAIAIDGSVWILMNDGNIKKYTKGKADELTLSGFKKPLNNPSRIWTSVDGDVVYILDKGNSRVVLMNKNGIFAAEYPSEIIGMAKDFYIDEKNKHILILANNKVYQIDIK